MRYYKLTGSGYILAVGTGNGGTGITEMEYNEITEIIRQRPQDTAETGYRLRTDLTWEPYEIEPPDPDPELDDTEALDILLGGDGV